MHTSEHAFSTMFTFTNRNLSDGSTWQKKMLTRFICLAICSIFGLNIAQLFRKVSVARSEKWLNLLMQVLIYIFFTGNHDLWTFGYLEKEIGLKVHRKPTIFDIKGKQFFLAHGDGLNDKSKGFAFIRKIFHSKTCQWLFRTLIPPSIGLNFGYKWSESNRKKHLKNGECKYKGENNEPLVCFAKQHNQKSPDINYYVFGHRHILLHLMLNAKTQMAILGDFMQQFTYATFDGENFEIHYFEAE